LPNEILLKIFSYVPTIDLIRNVSKVSRSFKQLSKDPLSHVALHLDDLELSATDFRNFKQFLKGKYSIQEVYLPFLDRFEFGTYLNQMILQQRCTRVIDCQSMDENGSQRVLKLLAQHPEKARQLKRFSFTCLTPDVMFVLPDFKNLTHLQVTELKSDSFNDLTRQAAVTLNKLECFSVSSEDSKDLDHSEWFSSFLEANQHSLKVLDLPDYECRTKDFESITSVCAQLETLNLNCLNVDKEDLLKMVNFRKISDLKITVSLQCFCPEVISVCWEKAPRNFKVSWNESLIFDLQNFTELDLTLNSVLVSERTISTFLFPRVTKLTLKYDAQLEHVSPFDGLEDLTDLHLELIRVWDFIETLNFNVQSLAMAKRKSLHKFQLKYSNSTMCYKSNSLTFENSTAFYHPKYLSLIFKKLKKFTLDRMTLTNSQVSFNESTLQSVFLHKSMKQLNLSFWDFHDDEDDIAKTIFAKLENLKVLTLNSQERESTASGEISWNMGSHFFKIKREGSTMYIPKFEL
jgi:hypothetical protein